MYCFILWNVQLWTFLKIFSSALLLFNGHFSWQEKSMPIFPTQSLGISSIQILVRRRRWHPTPVLLPGKSHWRRSLEGCSPWGHLGRTQLSDVTFTFHFHALEKEMATHSSVLAWRIPGMGEPGGLPSMGSHRDGHDWSYLAAAARRSEFAEWSPTEENCLTGK